MTRTEWTNLYSSLEHLNIFGSPLEKPTDSSLDRYEATSHFRLPKSYREFIKIFGPGMLGGDFSIRAPGYFKPTTTDRMKSFNWRVDLEFFNQAIRTTPLICDDVIAKPLFQDLDRIRNCVYFAGNTASEIIGWDPNDLRDSSVFEYGIYILLRDRNQLTLLAEDFASFILDVCFGPRYGQIVNPPDGDDDLPPRCFQPQGGFEE